MKGPDAIWLVRHGPIDVEYGVCVGSTDVPLAAAENALVRAKALASLIRSADAVYSSDARRAYNTAQALAAVINAPLETTPDLRELAFGAWEMRAWADIERDDPANYARFMADWRSERTPGGESYGDLEARVRNWWTRIAQRHDGGSVVVVGHGGSLRILASHLLSMTAEEAIFMPFGRGHAAIIRPATGARVLDIDPFEPSDVEEIEKPDQHLTARP
ncbi:MAG: histidine phosphatase family protein [Deltaproteobacteria bacterium]|nr:histidine phosphatase family protein [Deltaproteobacteria bacterium]